MKPTRLNRTGFSLIEMLVTIAIIVLVVALAMPALQAARRAARSAQCINNLHQLHVGYYNREIEEDAPNIPDIVPASWPGMLFEYMGQDNDILFCPEDELSVGLNGGIGDYYLDVFNAWPNGFLYSMPLEPDPLTFYVDRHTTDTAILTEVDPDITPAELDSIPEGSYRFYFEDLRPHGGDRDFRDVVLQIDPAPGGVNVTYIQDRAGYRFNFVAPDGTVIWENMDNGGTVQPGAGSTTFVSAGLSSYGMNEAAPRMDDTRRNPILLIDYEDVSVKWGMVNIKTGIASTVDTWETWEDGDGHMEFARHPNHTANLLFRDGAVEAGGDLGALDVALPANVKRYWDPD